LLLPLLAKCARLGSINGVTTLGKVRDLIKTNQWYLDHKNEIDQWCKDYEEIVSRTPRPPRTLSIDEIQRQSLKYQIEEVKAEAKNEARAIRGILKYISSQKWRFRRSAASALYRSKVYKAEGYTSPEELEIILVEQDFQCKFCGKELGLYGENGVTDHIIPFSKGGSNWPINIQWLCSRCNGIKGNKDPVEAARHIYQSIQLFKKLWKD
jgi:5-methylcytosine-specific restriction endonuclease McrA